MSQSDFNIANQSFPATRTDLNNALQALASNSSGDAEPSTTFANQWWYETDTNTLKLRNEANNAWLSFATVDQTTGAWTLAHDVTVSNGLTVSGAFTSLGIDDNATSTAITIDSSENVLVNTAVTEPGASNTTTGFSVLSGGGIRASSTYDTAAFNRTGTDGVVVHIRKDGTTVGSIGTSGGQLIIGTDNTGLRFQNSIPAIIPRTTSDGASDGVYDLGDSNARFKDLYLSGGVVFGTGGPSPITSNTLDSYEEGAFVPFLSNATGGDTATYTLQSGQYVKVGDLVYCQFIIVISAKGAGSGDIRIRGLPFTTSTSPDFAGANCDVFYNNAATSWVNLKAGATSANTQLYVYGQTAATTNTIREGNFTASDINSNFEIRCSITYRV